MKKVNKKIIQVITMSLLMASSNVVWASDFNDGFQKDLTLDSGSGSHNVGAIAPESNTIINKDIVYDFTLNQGKYTTNNGVLSLFINQDGKNFVYNGTADIKVSTDLTGTGNNSANAICLYADNVEFNGNTYITNNVKGENGKSAYGIVAFGDPGTANINFNGDLLKIDVTTDVARQGKATYCEAVAILACKADVITSADTKTEINITGTSTSEKATPVYGILNEAGNIDLKGDTVVNVETNGYGTNVTAGKDAAGLAVGVKVIDGLYNSNTSGQASTTLGNTRVNVINNANGGKAIGMEATNFTNGDNHEAILTVNGNLDVSTIADIARGIIAQDGKKVKLGSNNSDYININTNSINKDNEENVNIGIWAVKNGSVDINTKNLSVITNATGKGWAYGISAQNNTTDATDNFANVNIKADNIYVNSTSETAGQSVGFITMSQGQMNVHGNVEVQADEAIVTRGGAVLNINTDENDINNITKIDGNISFNYDENTSGTGVYADVNINLNGSKSYLNGNIAVIGNPEGSLANVDGMQLGLANGAQWTTDDNSFVNTLNFNGGIININGGEDQVVNLDKVNGTSGTVNIKADINEDKSVTSGKLNIGKDGAEGNLSKLAVNFTGINADNFASDKESKEALSNLAHNITKKDGQTIGNSIATIKEGIVGGKISGEMTFDNNTSNIAVNNINVNNSTTTMDNMRNIANVALIAWRQEDSTLSQRLGELRNSEGDQGIWTRMSRGEFEYDGAFKNQYNYFQIGYDKAYDNWHYGLAISHNDGQTTYANGNGENDSTSLSLYGTWLGDKGQYADIVLKQGKLNNEFTNYAEAGVTTGDYDMWGTSIGAEYGQKLELKNVYNSSNTINLYENWRGRLYCYCN